MFQYIVNKDEKSISDLEYKLKKQHARQQGHVENYFALFQRQKLYKTFSVLCTFNQKVNDLNLLFHSLRPILLKHPILASTLIAQDVPESVKPRPNDFIKVKSQVKFGELIYESSKFNGLENEELYSAINEIVISYGHDNLHWRLVIVDDHTLAFIGNHVCSDGIAGKYFFQDLEEQFNKYTPTTETNINCDSIIFDYSKDQDQMGTIPLGADHIIDYTPPLWFIPQHFYNKFMIEKFVPSSPTTTGCPQYYRKIHIPSSRLSKIKQDLIENERDKKITLTPYIQAAWLNAQERAQVYPGASLTNFLLAVDTRQYLPTTEKLEDYKYGMYNSAMNKFHHPVKQFTWSIVDYFNGYMKKCVKNGTPLYLLGFLTQEKNIKNVNLDEALRESNKKRLRQNTLFSNIGLIDSVNGSSIKIVDCVFTQNFHGNFYDWSINGVATREGGLNIVISVPSTVKFTEEKMNEVCDEFYKNMINECSK